MGAGDAHAAGRRIGGVERGAGEIFYHCGTHRAVYAAEIAPALEDEINQRVAAGEQDAIAKAIKAVGQRLVAP